MTLYKNNSFVKKMLDSKELSNGFSCFGICLQNYTLFSLFLGLEQFPSLIEFFLVWFKIILNNCPLVAYYMRG